MARHDSQQIKQWEAMGHAPLKANELHGRVRIAVFAFLASRDAGAGVVAQNDDVRLCQLPSGARILSGELTHGAFGAGTVLDIGLRALDNSGFINKLNTVADISDCLATDLDVSAAATTTKRAFEDMPFFLYETEKEVEVYATFQGANPADNVELKGYILYVVD